MNRSLEFGGVHSFLEAAGPSTHTSPGILDSAHIVVQNLHQRTDAPGNPGKKDAYFRWILFGIQLDYSRGHSVELSFCLKPGSNRNTQPWHWLTQQNTKEMEMTKETKKNFKGTIETQKITKQGKMKRKEKQHWKLF
jgi:hypothetical protein